MELNPDTEEVSAHELLSTIVGQLRHISEDIEGIRESQVKVEHNVKEIHGYVVLCLGDKCPKEFERLDVRPVLHTGRESRVLTPEDRQRLAKRAAIRAAAKEPTTADDVTDVGQQEASQRKGKQVKANTRQARVADVVPAKSTAAPSRKRVKDTTKEKDKVITYFLHSAFDDVGLEQISLRDSSALAHRLRMINQILATARHKVPRPAAAAPGVRPMVDFTTELKRDTQGHVVFGMLDGKGACLTYELSDTYDFGNGLQTALQEALESHDMVLPSEIVTDADCADVCCHVVSEVVMNELSAFKYKPLYLEDEVKLEHNGLSVKEFSDAQPEPVRSAIWSVYKMMDLKDSATTVATFAGVVVKVERYLQQKRLGNPPANAKKGALTEELENALVIDDEKGESSNNNSVDDE